jgi:hypothetical protein
MYTYRRRVVGVIEPANGHHLVVAVKFVLVSHLVDVDGTRDVVEFDGQHRVVALRVAIVVNPD